ncbi:hypothetical protein D3C72_1110530 [compost metagenome]
MADTQTDPSLDFSLSRRIVRCNCPSGKICSIPSSAEIAKMKSCPPDFFRSESNFKVNRVQGINMGQMMPAGSLMAGFVEMKGFVLSDGPTARPENSVLYPAQFRTITSPGCFAKNSLYYSCARDAYSRPFKFRGNCHAKPKECSDTQDWLR